MGLFTTCFDRTHLIRTVALKMTLYFSSHFQVTRYTFILCTVAEKFIKPQCIYKSQYGNGAPATSLYYLKLRGKRCRNPHYRNEVVDTLEQSFFFFLKGRLILKGHFDIFKSQYLMLPNLTRNET